MERSILLLITTVMSVSLALGGCSGASGLSSPVTADQAQMEAPTSTEISFQSAEESAIAEEGPTVESASGQEDPELTCQAGVRVDSLKGPTSMGLVSLIDKASKGETVNVYEFTTASKADELVDRIANGDLDTALALTNMVGALHNKTQGNITVLDINTLGVLYVVASDDFITSMVDLKGRSIYTTGKGTTPEYITNYLLKGDGFSASDADLRFKSETTEVASPLKEDSSTADVLPRSFATVACTQNPDLKTVLDPTE